MERILEASSEYDRELAEDDEERGDRSIIYTNLFPYADHSMETTGTAFREPHDEQENFQTEIRLAAESLR